MLALSPVRNVTKDENKAGGGGGGGDVGVAADIIQMCEFTISPEEFPEFADDHGNLLESIDFDDLFIGIDSGDALPDLEIDPEILAGEFSDQMNTTSSTVTTEKAEESNGKEEGEKGNFGKGEEVVSKREDDSATAAKNASHGSTGGGGGGGEKKRKYASASSKNNNNNSNNSTNNSKQGKRKVKVDWTPELHRRFVQAVEQLGVDKAVPSRILELMGIDCLTRHNVASHLQKYRSHRKHLLAREAEAASWTHKRQMCGGMPGGSGRKNGWLAPTIGFPPPVAAVAPPVHHHHPHFRPLHVWGHPTVDHQSVMPHIWPKHIPPHSPSAPPPLSVAMAHPPIWGPLPSSDPAYWQRVPTGPMPGTSCYPQSLVAPTRFGAPPVPGIPQPQPPHSMYKVDPSFGILAGQSGPRPPVDLHPSTESIDAAIGDVLTKPWLPLPLGLKPPSTDSVMTELHRHGVSEVPPTPSCA